MNLTVSFDEGERGLPSLVGGKGANLVALTGAGFPVPPGFVVTSAAYDLCLQGNEWLAPEVAALEYDRPDRLRDQCANLRRRLLETEPPAPLTHSIREGLRRLAVEGAGGAYAVRSSSTLEDMAQAAFAGQHETYLNVHAADVTHKVLECFASLWEDRAVLYRHHRGFSHSAARMAVVVQCQIECDAAGVAFSIDPVSGRMNTILVDANYGLGESVVAGESEVDHFELDKADLKVAKRVLGHKERRTVLTATGTETRATPSELVDAPCIDDAQLAAIGDLLRRVETHYGWPQDIEWGLKNGRLYQFQSRPVTTIEPRWTRDESAERFPNAMTPLSWDFINIAFSASLKHSFALMGLPPLKGDWFHIFDHYVYGNQNAVGLLGMYRPLKARNAAELILEAPEIRHRFGWVIDLPVDWARDLDRYLIRLGRLEAVSEPATLQEAWRHVNDVLAAVSEYFLPNIAISMTQSALHRLLYGLVQTVSGPQRAPALVDGLLAGCETKTTAVNRELYEMAEMAAAEPKLRKNLLDLEGKTFLDTGRMSAYPDFGSRFLRFLEDHGHREVDIDYSQPTWSGQPWVVLDSLRLILRGGTASDPAEAARAQRVRHAETEQQFIASVPKPLQFFFRELIRLTRTYTVLDDLEHYETTRVNPLAHRGALWVGRHLKDMGIIENVSDVFLLNKGSLDALVADPSDAQRKNCREALESARASYASALQRTPAWSLDESAERQPAGDPGKLLRGLPGSPGRASGPCFIVRGPEDFGRFPAKGILVARTTNPAWTPLFYSASAVITESGGPLSHGAVTAREMGLPAVMGVRGAMTALAEGQVVAVDGSQGVVDLS